MPQVHVNNLNYALVSYLVMKSRKPVDISRCAAYIHFIINKYTAISPRCYPRPLSDFPSADWSRAVLWSYEYRLTEMKSWWRNRSYSRCPPSLHALKEWWDKSDVTWLLVGQTSDKICRYKKSRCFFFILDNSNWRTFIFKTKMANYGWKWSLLLYKMQWRL